jgi:hypothetical protein
LRVAVELGMSHGLKGSSFRAGWVQVFTQIPPVRGQNSSRPVRLGSSEEEWPHDPSVPQDTAEFIKMIRVGQDSEPTPAGRDSYPTVLSFVATEVIRARATKLSTFCERLPQRADWTWDGEWLRLHIPEWSNRWRPDLEPAALERSFELVEDLAAVLGRGAEIPIAHLIYYGEADTPETYGEAMRDLMVLYQGGSEVAKSFLTLALTSSCPLVRVSARLELGEESTETKEFGTDLSAALGPYTQRNLNRRATVAEQHAERVVARALEQVWGTLKLDASNDKVYEFLRHLGQPGFNKALELFKKSLPELEKKQKGHLLHRLVDDAPPSAVSGEERHSFPEAVYELVLREIRAEHDLVPISSVLGLARRDGWSETFHLKLAEAVAVIADRQATFAEEVESWLLWRIATPVSSLVDLVCIRSLGDVGGVRSVAPLTTYCDELLDDKARKQAARAALGQIHMRLKSCGADAGQLTFLTHEDDSEKRGQLSEVEADGAVSLEDSGSP